MTSDKQASDREPLRRNRVARLASVANRRRTREEWTGEPAAIYCRISHVNDDDQTGVDRQQRICRETAERLKLDVPEKMIFVDNNRSAWKRNRKRPGWDALLGAARDGKVRHILTYHPDRLMRQPYDLEELLQVADDQDITLHGQANRRDLSDPDDRFFLRIEVAHACRSSDDTSRRILDATADRARDGKPHGGKRRFGYDKSGEKIIPEEAKIVYEIFKKYVEGATPYQMSRSLHGRGILTALGKEFNPSSVYAILDSPHVAGIRMYRGEEVGDGEWPAIIEKDCGGRLGSCVNSDLSQSLPMMRVIDSTYCVGSSRARNAALTCRDRAGVTCAVAASARTLGSAGEGYLHPHLKSS
jgi:site-specific DNA recombinase